MHGAEDPAALMRHFRREVSVLTRLSGSRGDEGQRQQVHAGDSSSPPSSSAAERHIVGLRGIIVESTLIEAAALQRSSSRAAVAAAAAGNSPTAATLATAHPFGVGLVFDWLPTSLRDALLAGLLRPTGHYQHRHWFAQRQKAIARERRRRRRRRQEELQQQQQQQQQQQDGAGPHRLRRALSVFMHDVLS